MAVIAFASLTGSPGVTSTALAAAVHWPRPVVFVEVDTSAVSTVMAGFFRGNFPASVGLDKVALANARSALTATTMLDPTLGLSMPVHTLPRIDEHPIPTIPDGHQLWIVPGFPTLATIDGTASLWNKLPSIFRALAADGVDVIIDVSRLGRDDPRLPLLDAADQVVIVGRSTLVDLSQLASRIALPDLASRLAGIGLAERFSMILIDSRWEVVRAKDFAVNLMPVIAELPFDPEGAAVFSLGRPDHRPDRNSYRNRIRKAVSQINQRISLSEGLVAS